MTQKWPGLFLLTSCPSSIPMVSLVRTRRILKSFGQIIRRMPLHPAVDGKSRPFIDPQTKAKEANPKRPLWTTFIARPCGKDKREGETTA